jgi:hypothetical protein
VLGARFPGALPDDVRLAVEGTNDLDTLARWVEVAATAASPDAFRTAITSR